MASAARLYAVRSISAPTGVVARIAPLVAAVTLGIVGREAYGAQVSRNEALNHAGNAGPEQHASGRALVLLAAAGSTMVDAALVDAEQDATSAHGRGRRPEPDNRRHDCGLAGHDGRGCPARRPCRPWPTG
jgi:hypothetical protein